MKRAFQAATAEAQQSHGDPHVVSQQGDVALSSKVYLTHAEAAAYLGLSVKALKRRMERRTIPLWTWTRMGQKSIRFVRASLDEWLGRRHSGTVRRSTHFGQSKTLVGQNR